MLKDGDEIKIVYSTKLADMQLIPLVGQRAIILKVVRRKRNSGAYVQITKGKNHGEEWFIPQPSIQTPETLNKLRTLGLIKSTKI
jgi:hypothetical protein